MAVLREYTHWATFNNDDCNKMMHQRQWFEYL